MGSDHPNILTGKTVALCLAVRQVVQLLAAPVVLHCPALDMQNEALARIGVSACPESLL